MQENTAPTANQQYKFLIATDNFNGTFKNFMQRNLFNHPAVLQEYNNAMHQPTPMLNDAGEVPSGSELTDNSKVQGFDKEPTMDLSPKIEIITPTAKKIMGMPAATFTSVVVVVAIIGSAMLVAHLMNQKQL